MSSLIDQRKPVRVVAFSAGNVQSLKTVNILTAKPVPQPEIEIKEYVQLTAAQSQVGTNPTLMDAAGGGTVKGIPTIYINGYTAPN